MLSRSARRALLRDASDAWQAINTTLQMMAHASSQGIYGRGRRRGRSGPNTPTIEAIEAVRRGEVETFETVDDMLRSLRE